MKTKFIIIALSFFTFFSCADPGGDPVYEGFSLSIFNFNEIGANSFIYIGRMENNVFVATDSIKITLKTNSNGLWFLNENRWKPNLDKIRNIPSERCYFMLKLSNSRQELIKRYQQNTLFSLLLPNEANFKGDYGRLLISIFEDEITAYAAKEID